MKCPKCHQVFSNDLIFCLNDGTRLVQNANLLEIDKKMSAETILINHSAKPTQKKSKWLLFSIAVTVFLIFMTAGVILGLQTLNNFKQQAKVNQNGNSKTENGNFDTQISDEILDLNDSKIIDKLKNAGLINKYKNDPNEIMKPNPLVLVVKINSQNGDLKLNNENAGNVLENNSLGEKLSRIFKDREENGVYVENSANNNNSTDLKVVKEVFLSSNSQIKANYFYKTLDILKKSGATPIYLTVENSVKTNAENKTSGCQLDESVNIQSQKITFSSSSNAITPGTKTVLESLAEDFKQLPADCRIEIGVHTDNVGDTEMNTRLSFARAMSLKQFLVKLGVEENKLSVMGYGSSEPKYPNDTIEGKKGNRRTEFKIVGKN